MHTIADLHIHSKYSRATSPQMEPVMIDFWAKKKGINIVGTGDFTHPAYFKELKDKLVEDGSGLLELKVASHQSPVTSKTKFMLTSEIACIYKHGGKCRRLHICVNAPSFETVSKINAELTRLKCNLRSDGRPIIGLSAKQLAELCFSIDERVMIIPAHAWTPWFAVFGSKSGYDSLQECFEELTPKIFAIETGLSSDPAMNWRLSQLDDITLLSNSDAHSPANLGREANVFDLKDYTYDEIREIIKTKDKKRFLYTIEFFPQEGKYHYDGHLSCNFSCAPHEAKLKYKNICPKCKRPLVLGVDHRVEDLADRPLGFKPKNLIPYKSLIPLQEIIAECQQKTKSCKSVVAQYEEMIAKGGSEFNILLNLSRNDIKNISTELIAEAIMRMRDGKIIATPGYDGVYGVIKVFKEGELLSQKSKQKVLL
ncbi:MAG: and RNA helicase protein [Parcubacteria group bacterium GW2011_GWC2_39_14]|nr:MAG: and RNA helicase protein [Parcubacteria group bacterium GW2011_GWC2_39_14]KKR54347.1 MAG: and RNA helicase protein [Parcubacteria group bacterium GW2011_GWA2_40_23]